MSRLLAIYAGMLKGILTVLLAVMIVPVALQILSRFTGLIPKYIWTEEVARFCFVWLVMVGSALAVRDGTHFEVAMGWGAETPRKEARARLFSHFAMMVLAIVFGWFGLKFVQFGFGQRSEMSEINMAAIYVAFPFAGFSWSLFLFEKILCDLALLSRREGER